MSETEFIPYDELTAEQRAIVDSELPEDHPLWLDSFEDPYERACEYYGHSWSQRCEAVERGWAWDELVFDGVDNVRASVASMGYGLDILWGDESDLVCEAVDNYLLEHSLTIAEWIDQNPDKCALLENKEKTGIAGIVARAEEMLGNQEKKGLARASRENR